MLSSVGQSLPFRFFNASSTSTENTFISDKRNFENRTLSLSGQESNITIQKIFDGNVTDINQIFLTKQTNSQTILMREIIKAILLNPSQVQIVTSYSPSSTKIVINKKEHLLFPLLAKVKWDLITLDQNELNEYVKKSKNNQYSLSASYVPYCNNYKKKHLYGKLHDAEKMAIAVYKSSGSSLNSFLRQKLDSYNINSNYIKSMLAHIAVLSSALNRIPPSVDGYLYRCMSDSTHANGVGLITDIDNKMKKQETFKELGFTSLSLYKPLSGFMYGSEQCLKIYQNPYNMAKDISGIGEFESENECLFLPNSKDRPLRKIKVVEKQDNEYQKSIHVFLTRVVSKRLGAF